VSLSRRQRHQHREKDLSFLSDEECKRLAQTVLGHATAPETVVYLNPSRGGNTRFARNDVSTSGAVETMTITVQSQYGLKVGRATANQLDDASLQDVLRRAEETARLAPEDPETMPVLGPQTYEAAPSLHTAEVEALSPEARGAVAAEALETARTRGLEAAGFIQHFSDADAMATSKGLLAYRRTSSVAYSLTMRTRRAGSGWGGGVANALRHFDPAAMTARAADLAQRSEDPVALEPGNYTAILSAECVADLATTALGGFDQRSLDEGRSFLSQLQKDVKDGKRIFGEQVTITCDFTSELCPANNFDQEGSPISRGAWVAEGVVKRLACSRYWAKKTGREPMPSPSSLIMTGGTASLDELVAGCKRGVLVTRFWYVRQVDPQTALFTGLTRDGCFLVENGKVSRPVKNFRWNETPVKMLRNIEAMGKSRRVITSEQDLGSALCFPDLRVSDFTFSSLSDAV
jgi:predicted Zn-dependent protease